MMFEVEHVTTYAYSGPVALGPHVVRLRPREDGAQRLHGFHLDVQPAPAGTADVLDVEGNRVVNAWFTGTTQRLDLRASFLAETLAMPEPVLTPSLEHVPLAYAPDMAQRLAPYRAAPESALVREFARGAADEAGGATLPFLLALARRVRRDVRGVVRRVGPPLDPESTLAKGEGACRDQAVLFLEAARAMGFAARFVSGYHELGPGQPERDLHAWAEVYLGGAGWRGYDPSTGQAVGVHHVAVAAGRLPGDAAPVEGTFDDLDARVQSRLEARVAMRTRPA